MTRTLLSRNRYTFYIENKFIITEFLPYVRQFCDKDKVFYMNRFLSHLIKPHSHCAGVATVHPDAGQPVYRDAPGHIS